MFLYILFQEIFRIFFREYKKIKSQSIVWCFDLRKQVFFFFKEKKGIWKFLKNHRMVAVINDVLKFIKQKSTYLLKLNWI